MFRILEKEELTMMTLFVVAILGSNHTQFMIRRVLQFKHTSASPYVAEVSRSFISVSLVPSPTAGKTVLILLYMHSAWFRYSQIRPRGLHDAVYDVLEYFEL